MKIYSISIVSHGSTKNIKKLFESAQEFLADNNEYEIILTSNIPDDYNYKEAFPNLNISIINNESVKGFGENHNAAFLASQSNYFFIVNPDIIVTSNVFYEISKYFDLNHDVSCVVPKVIYPDGTIQHLCKLLPTPLNLFVRRFFPKLADKLDYHYEMRWFNYDKKIEVPYVSGCFMAVRSSAFKAIGGFDEQFFMYLEDTDISRRLSKVGKVMFYPEVEVIHVHAKESYKNKKLLLTHIQSAIKYFNKWGWVFDQERKRINDNAKKSILGQRL